AGAGVGAGCAGAGVAGSASSWAKAAPGTPARMVHPMRAAANCVVAIVLALPLMYPSIHTTRGARPPCDHAFRTVPRRCAPLPDAGRASKRTSRKCAADAILFPAPKDEAAPSPA